MEKKRKSVRGIITTSKGLVAIYRKKAILSDDKEVINYKEYYVLPGGGIEAHENKEDALKREIKEELDIDISVQKYLAFDVFSYEDITIKLSLYLCKISSGTIHDEEHSLLKWCTKEEMKDLDWSEADKKLLIYIL